MNKDLRNGDLVVMLANGEYRKHTKGMKRSPVGIYHDIKPSVLHEFLMDWAVGKLRLPTMFIGAKQEIITYHGDTN